MKRGGGLHQNQRQITSKKGTGQVCACSCICIAVHLQWLQRWRKLGDKKCLIKVGTRGKQQNCKTQLIQSEDAKKAGKCLSMF
jgi:peptidyl-tRNA hydrolase